MRKRMIKMIEKPKYGWYARDIIFVLSVISLIGLVATISGFFLQGLLGLVLLIVGIVILALFLWPSIGMTLLNAVAVKKIFDLPEEMKALQEIEDSKILDVGCGTGRTAIKIAKALNNGGHLTGIDIYEKHAISGNALDTVQKNARIEKVDDRTTFQYGSATDIPFEDETFDIVNISSVLHEIHEANGQEKAVKELYRVLKPEGYLYVGEWNRTSWQTIAYTGIFCFVFKNHRYWNNLIKKQQFKDIQYKNVRGFGLFTIRK
jgi:arsenite methyltransferase